jgi:hypothetical protein
VACSDDGDAPRKDTGSADQSTVDLSVSTDQATSEQGTSDTAAAVPDQSPSPDVAQAKVLDNQHTGWLKKACGDCHNIPPNANHTASKPPECAQCHGGNGACDPPASHDKSMNCTQASCHANGRHGFTKGADCVSCHFAAAGTTTCGP